MLRILTTKNIPFNNLNLLRRQNLMSLQNKPFFVQVNLTKCVLNGSKNIEKFDYKVDKRFQSTRHRVEALIKKKRKRRANTKYVELLQVTNASTKQTKTKVKNLKARTLSDFIQENEIKPQNKKSSSTNKSVNKYQIINLEIYNDPKNQSGIYGEKPLIFIGKDTLKLPLQNVNEIMESLETFKENLGEVEQEHEHGHENVLLDPFIQETDIVENEKLPSDDYEVIGDDLETLNKKGPIKGVVNKKETNKTKQPKISKYHKSPEDEKLAKELSLKINLNSYVSVCVATGMVNRAFTTLITYRQRHKDKKFLGITIYNLLLHGYAEKGNYTRIKEILRIVEEDGIELNHQSFAAIFECFGRLEMNDNNVNELKKYVEKAEQMGITLNDVMDKSKFHSDQREIILDAINRIKPDFEPIYKPPKIIYNNPLLNELNEDIKNFDSETQIEENNNQTEKHNRIGYSAKELKKLANEQLKVELGGSITIKSIEKVDEQKSCEHYRKKLDELMISWKSQICSAINRDMNALKARMRHKPNFMTYLVYLKALDTGQYADILLKEIKCLAEGSETYSPTVNQLYKELGNKVRIRYLVEQKQKNGVLHKIGDVYSEYCNKLENSNLNKNDNLRQIWQRIVYSKKSNGPNVDLNEYVWPNNVSLYIGKFLYNILMRDVKIDRNVMKIKQNSESPSTTTTTTKNSPNLLPAFYTLFRNHGKVVKEEVKPHPILSRLLRTSQQQTLTFDANLIPMLCPPLPWSSPVSGGYLLTKSELVRLPSQAIQQRERINKSNPADLYPALDSLNQLSSIPWKVNTDVLDIILKVFNDGGDLKLGIPQRPNTLPSIPEIASLTANDPSSNLSKEKQVQLFQQKMVHRRKQAEMYSLWCDALYRLSLANHFRDKVFWLPHNMDFRGRVYPIPPHLNHLGSDMARSMLIFDQARPLGTDGFTWLKLHCVNLTGLKKRDSVRERLLYAEEIMDDIIDSADNPLTGRRWWTKSDEPWQTLACCIEIAKVKRSPNPEEYMSHFPIHQDGSCNGLQHYAALGRDKAGAFSVNLTPSNVPQDVYSAVAILVEKMRKDDEENGVQIAKILNGFVRRKVIKQTVMTTVYGVTRYGARLQIAKQLKDIDEFPKECVWRASSYLTSKTFESLREMFTSTREIQDWFTECARVISNTCNQNVEWITPLGLPIVQPYNNRIENSVKILQNNSSKINEKLIMDMYEKPNTMKQKNAFPPNFIHSLDSSHMMLTSLHCERKGITFVSVHDCFWTHACTVPDMNKICREQFVALHSQPILEDLSKFLVEKYRFYDPTGSSDLKLTNRRLRKILKGVPQKGDFDLNDVLNSVYFFS